MTRDQLRLAYDPGFYAEQMDRSRESAELVVPLIVEALRPKSVIDIGCGVGFWPLAFLDAGTEIAHGVDGPWVEPRDRKLPAGAFIEFDFERLETPFRPLLPRDRYDLVTSFEFVEHIEERFADALIDLFCRLSDVVIVGGAIPYQRGYNHVNEQWPAYWIEKFERRGYEACDFIRPQVWCADIDPWYAQNPIAYFKGGAPKQIKALAKKAWGDMALRPVVHPGQWIMSNLELVPPSEPLLKRLTPRRLAGRLKREISSRFG